MILDQYSLRGAGADRGLGRYAKTVAEALRNATSTSVIDLHGSTNSSGSELFAIQNGIAHLKQPRSVPYHATSVDHLPILKTRPWVCSIQDVIPLDLSGYRRLGIKTRLRFFSARRAEVIVANSRYTADRISARLKVNRNDIEVCPLPVANAYVTAFAPKVLDSDPAVAEARARPYIVALADLRSPDPRKRFHWINDLAHGLSGSGIRMIVTGRGLSPEDFPETEVVPALDDEALARLYSLALATFYPSSYEGQGLPPLEAMAAGCPVVAFRNTSITEMVKLSEFLVDDPIPWVLQDLSAPMPSGTMNFVVNRLKGWREDPDRLQSLREEAHDIATDATLSSLGASLATIYARLAQ